MFRPGRIWLASSVTLVVLSAPPLFSAPDEPLPRSAAAAQRESVTVYSDGMENGAMDILGPPHAGEYAVVEDGGSEVAVFTGDSTPRPHEMAWSSRTWADYTLTLRAKRSSSGSVAFGIRSIPFWPEAPNQSDRGYWLQNSGSTWELRREVRGTNESLATASRTTAAGTWFSLEIDVTTVSTGVQIKAALDSVALIDHVDTGASIPYGGFQFRTTSGAELRVDDVKVVEHVDPRRTWVQSGGPEGGMVTAIAVDSSDARVAYVGGYDGGVFKTTDGGVTWNEIGTVGELWGVRIRAIEIAPSDHDVVYVATGAKGTSSLWRSDDGGTVWKWTGAGAIDTWAETYAVAVDPADALRVYFPIIAPTISDPSLTGIYASSDGGVTISKLTSAGGEIGVIEVDPGDGRHILAASSNPSVSGSRIVASWDGGASWTASDSGIGSGMRVLRITLYEADPTYVFALVISEADPEAEPKVYRSTDGGRSWSPLSALSGARHLLNSPQATPKLLAFTDGGLQESSDKGDSWTLLADNDCVKGLMAVGSDDTDAIYAVSRDTVQVSFDGGATCASRRRGLKVHPIAGFGLSPSNSSVVYAGGLNTLYKSSDDARTWKAVRNGQYPAIAVHPADPDTVYIGSAEFARIEKSTDGGTTWSDVSGGISFPGIGVLVIDPTNPEVVYAGTGHGPQMGGGGDGVYKSTNGGASWTRLGGIPALAVPAIAVDPSNPSRIVAGTMGKGVYVSTDGGSTFAQSNAGILSNDGADMYVWTLAIDPKNPQVIYAGTNNHYASLGTAVSVPPADTVYKSTDGGVSWTIVLGGAKAPNPSVAPLILPGAIDGIAIDPTRPDEIYVALHNPGLVMSEDAGATWTYVNNGFMPLMSHSYPYRIAISDTGKVMYATSCGRGVFRNFLTKPETAGLRIRIVRRP